MESLTLKFASHIGCRQVSIKGGSLFAIVITGDHTTIISIHDGKTDIMTNDNGKVQYRTGNSGNPLCIAMSSCSVVWGCCTLIHVTYRS